MDIYIDVFGEGRHKSLRLAKRSTPEELAVWKHCTSGLVLADGIRARRILEAVLYAHGINYVEYSTGSSHAWGSLGGN